MILDKIKFLESVLGKVQSGPSKYNDVLFKCVFCGHHKPKLSVNLDEDENGNFGKYHCWVCDAKSQNILRILKLQKKYDHIKTYAQHIKNSKWLDFGDVKNEYNSAELALPEGFTPLSISFTNSSKNNFLNNKIQNALHYLRGVRKIKNDDVVNYLLGISTDRQYYNRIIIPSFDKDGSLNFFTSRTIDAKQAYRYKNCNRDRTTVIFNEVNIDFELPLLVVEGPFDVIRANVNATCLLGSSLSKKSELFKQIVLNKTSVLLCLDNDSTGRIKTIHIASLLFEYGIDVKVINIKDCKDIADMDSEEWKKLYNEQIMHNNLDKIALLENKIGSII